MTARKTISFVIPVFRNEGALAVTHQRIVDVLASHLQAYGCEFVFVDDGSDDGSLRELREIQKRDPTVRVVSFTRNFGQMAAIQAGLKEATGDLVMHLSADLQDPVELIPRLVREHEQGTEVAVGYRTNRADAWSSQMTSRLFYAVIRLSFPQIPAGGFDCVLMDRRVVDAFNQLEVRNRFFQGDILWLGYRTVFVPYTRARRTIGRSQYTFWKRLKNSLDAILDSSYLPIRFISLMGVFTAFGGFLYAADIVYWRLRHNANFPGWAPLMVITLIVGGMIMVMLGIIGEYVWRIYDEVKGKPNYVIRDRF
jgi:dolichol-phosphate mannosyltransferase